MPFVLVDLFPRLFAYVLLFVLLIFTAAYVLHCHRPPFNNIPGPFLARYTDGWRCYQAWKAPKYKGLGNYQMTLFEKYGDVVRIGPNTVLLNDPETAHLVLGFKERLEKGPGYKALAMSGTSETALLGIKNEEIHRSYRRPIAHAYSVTSLKGYEAEMDETIDTLVRKLDEKANGGVPTNMGDWLHYWAFDVISKISFGKSLGFVNHGCDFNGMIRSQKAAFRYFSVVSQMPILDALLKRNPILNYLGLIKPSVFLKFGRRMVRERAEILSIDSEANKKADGLYTDMLGYFFAAKEKYPSVMTNQRISMYCLVNVVAGANNSALAMGRTMQYFAQHPQDWEQLRLSDEEGERRHDSAKNKSDPIALDLAFKILYLEGVINESLRLMPTLSSNLERTLSSAGVTLPDGTWLPPGTNAAVNQSLMTRRKDVFGEDALKFKPRRWMRQEGESEHRHTERRAKMKRAMLQFGAGSRACIGQHFVTLEMYKIWGTLARRYTFEPYDHSGVLMKVKRRRSDACTG